MARKISSGIVIALSSILLILSVVGIGAAWYYNEPLTKEALSRLGEVEAELTRTQTALHDARDELDRTLRIVDSAEQTLSNLSGELAQAKQLFDEFDKTMGNKLIPGLQSSRDRLASLRGTLENLREQLKNLNSLPLLGLSLPGDQLLGNLIETVNSIDAQIESLRTMAEKASTFSEDISYLMGGDFSETRQRLETFVQVVDEYEKKVDGWHTQVQAWMVAVPFWIDRASLILTLFLLWFGFSQFSLLLHGLTAWRGGDPLLSLRREPLLALSAPEVSPVVAELEERVDELEEDVEKLEVELEDEVEKNDTPDEPE